MHPAEIKQRIEEKWPDATVQITDLTGTADHWQVTVVAETFQGHPMLEQHRMVKKLFESEIASGSLHAFSLKTYTPEEWSRKRA